jgi:hypothetical protein
MPTIVNTSIDTGAVALGNNRFRDDVIAFAGADVFVPGTVLARRTDNAKLFAYVKGGASNGNGVPVAVLTYEVTATGAGDIRCQVLVSGDVKKERLILDADGTSANVDSVVTDLLRSISIIPIDTNQLDG